MDHLRQPPTRIVGTGARRMFVRNLVLPALVGVWAHERDREQRIRVNLDLLIDEEGGPAHDELAQVVSYDDVVAAVRAVIAAGHVKLVETLAERFAERCLEDARVRSVRVRIEKLDVLPEAESVGIEIERLRG